MNSTLFSIYKNGIDSFKKKDGKGKGKAKEGEGRPGDIKKHPLTRLLYVKNCDRFVDVTAVVFDVLLTFQFLFPVQKNYWKSFFNLPNHYLSFQLVSKGFLDIFFFVFLSMHLLSSSQSFYYVNEINNVFLEKMEDTIEEKVQRHER